MGRSKRLLRIIYIVFIIVIFSVSEVGIRRRENTLRNDDRAKTETRAGAAAYFIEYLLSDYIKSMESIAVLNLTKEAFKGDEQAYKELVSTIKNGGKDYKYAEDILFILPDGEILGSLYNVTTELGSSERAYIKSNNGKTVVSGFIMEGETSRIVISAPVIEDGVSIGYITALLDTEFLTGVSEFVYGTGEDCFLFYDENGQCVISEYISDKVSKVINLAGLWENEEDSLNIGNCFIYKNVIALDEYNINWKCYYVLSEEDMYDFFVLARLFIAAMCVLLGAIGLIAFYVMKKYYEKPLISLTNDVKDIISSGNYKISGNKTGNAYIDGVRQAINEALHKLDSTEAAADLLMRKHPKLFEDKKIIFVEWDLASLRMTVSDYYSEIFGRELVKFGDRDFTPERLGIHPDDATGFNEWLKNVRAGRDTESFICKKIMADGRYRYMEYSFVIECDETGAPEKAFGYIMDVDRFIRKEIALRRAAEMDRYSGAYNKYVFMEKFKALIEAPRRKKDRHFVALVNLNNYYRLEDEAIGAGEAAMRFIFTVLEDNMECTVGRVLNDSFGVIFCLDDVDFIWSEIIKELNLGFEFENKKYSTSVTAAICGIERLPNDVGRSIGAFVKEYERINDNNENRFYFMKGKK